jgi:hypothetical protein
MPMVLAKLPAAALQARGAFRRIPVVRYRVPAGAGARPLERVARVDWHWARVGLAEQLRSRAGQPALRLERAARLAPAAWLAPAA